MNHLTFNFAGNGDSIIIHSHDDGPIKAGFIDFGFSRSPIQYQGKIRYEVDRRTPSLRFIEDNDIKEIEFVVVTHGHRDHYNGLPEFLDYCKNKNITIKKLLHPFAITREFKNVNNKYMLEFIDKRMEPLKRSQLEKLLILIGELRNSGHILKVVTTPIGKDVELNDDISLKVLSPGDDEIEEFIEGDRDLDQNQSTKNVNDLINLLSMVHLLQFGDSTILLTADAPIHVLDRIADDLPKDRHRLVQVPHHGCGTDIYFMEMVWDRLTVSGKNIAVISTGPNPTYKHPFKRTVEHLDKTCDVYSTMHVYGLKEHYGPRATRKTHGSKEFTYTKSNIKFVPKLPTIKSGF